MRSELIRVLETRVRTGLSNYLAAEAGGAQTRTYELLYLAGLMVELAMHRLLIAGGKGSTDCLALITVRLQRMVAEHGAANDDLPQPAEAPTKLAS